MKWTRRIVIVELLILMICVGINCYLWGLRVGRIQGAEQMARHVFNPRFHTESFVAVVEEINE